MSSASAGSADQGSSSATQGSSTASSYDAGKPWLQSASDASKASQQWLQSWWTACAHCGAADAKLRCAACKTARYCARDCQLRHHAVHKSLCAAARAVASEPCCPLCADPMPRDVAQIVYHACCGKESCASCWRKIGASPELRSQDCCPFCRAPNRKTDEELLSRLRRGVDRGDRLAMRALGIKTRDGTFSVARDVAAGLALLERAATPSDGGAGNRLAQADLAKVFDNGTHGVAVDEVRAERWCRLAAEAGDGDGLTLLGHMYADGRGGLGAPSEAAAAPWYRLAARRGHPDAVLALAGALLFGERDALGPANIGLSLFVDLAERGHAEAQYKLGRCYLHGEDPPRTVEDPDVVTLDLDAALDYLERAARQGHEAARDVRRSALRMARRNPHYLLTSR